MTINIPEPIASFIDTVNRHDRKGFLDAFTADGAVDDWGRTFTGREAIDAWSEKEFIGAEGTLTPEEVATNGEAVTIIGDWRSSHANGRSSFTFHITANKFSQMTIREG